MSLKNCSNLSLACSKNKQVQANSIQCCSGISGESRSASHLTCAAISSDAPTNTHCKNSSASMASTAFHEGILVAVLGKHTLTLGS